MCALAVLLLFGPVLGYLAGKRPAAFENHGLAPFPSARSGWGFFNGFNSWATDHLVGRYDAVQANRQLEASLFHEQPPPAWQDWATSGIPLQEGGSTGELAELRQVPDYAVLPGLNGVLYYWQDFQFACLGVNLQTQGLVPVINELRTALNASGRQVYYTIAPDKSTVESRFLPSSFLGRDCSAKAKAKLWKFMATDPPQGYIPLLPALDKADHDGPDLVYRRKDTHWNGVGAMIYAKQLVNALSPGALADTDWDYQPDHPMPADLSMLQGGLSTVPALNVVPQRAGVTTDAGPMSAVTIHPHVKGSPGSYQLEYWHSQSTSTGAPLVQPRVLILGDSFTFNAEAQLAPFFSNVSFLHLDSLYMDPQAALSAIRGAQVVIVERCERDLHDTGIQLAPGLGNELEALPGPTS